MHKTFVVGSTIALLMGAFAMATPVIASAAATAPGGSGGKCWTIQSGKIHASNGDVITTGFDKYGYNYQAHEFNGYVGNIYRPATPVTSGDRLVMKWSDSWLSNKDCNHDGLLDRGLVDGVVTGTSMGWETNHYTGTYVDQNGVTQHYTAFYKIVYVGPGGPLWNDYEVIQENYSDTAGGNNIESHLGQPGFGINDQWTVAQ